MRLVAERHPGVVTETELACIERDEDVGLADLGLRLDEAKRLAAALRMVPARMAALGKCPRACAACGRRLAAKGHYGATFRSLLGDVPVRVRRLFVCPCGGEDGAKSIAALDFGGDAVAPELAYVTARCAALVPYAVQRRRGEAIATSFMESAVDEIIAWRMTKQQMRWNRATAQPFFDVRTAVLNGMLEDSFRRCHPSFRPADDDRRRTAAA